MSDVGTLRVDPSNAEALAAWDGDDGELWTREEARFDRAVAAYHEPLLDAAAIGAADRVLDIGCGTGQTTRDAARRAPAGWALGIDLSSRMLARARARAADEGIANARFEQTDAQVHAFEPGGFDVAVSRTGAMFFGDPVAAFANIGRALRPGGRLALLVWQQLADNHWIRDVREALAAGRTLPEPPPDAPGPFSLADPTRTRSILEAAGFVDVGFDGRHEPMWFGVDADDAERFLHALGLVRFLLADLDDDARARALADLRRSVEAHEGPDGVCYPSATWIVTAARPSSPSAPGPSRG